MNLTRKDLPDVGLPRVAHKTITLVPPQAFPFARRPAGDLRPRS